MTTENPSSSIPKFRFHSDPSTFVYEEKDKEIAFAFS